MLLGMSPAAHNLSLLFIELGLAIMGLAVLARLANRWGFSSIPLYLLAGLAFGRGGLAPLNFSQEFIRVGAEIGVLLLLFMLGLEYGGEQLKQNLRRGLLAGVLDFFANFLPGLLAGFLLGWKTLPAVLLGGVTYISSSGIAAKVLAELRRMGNVETPLILSVLVLEDLAMAVYLPIVGVLLAGGRTFTAAVSIGVAVAVVLLVLFIAVRYGKELSDFAVHESDEILLLTTLGVMLLVAGFAERFQVSAAIGAFLVGIAVSGPVAERSYRLVSPLRDLFAATFFFFFGLEIDPRNLPSVLLFAIGLGGVTALTKIGATYWVARRREIDPRGSLRAGMALVARGEFSIVIAGLGVGLEPQLGPLAAAYVLFLAVLGPILARLVK
jgi:CPA2 family monovalent cation:H+ antiporter-2